MTEEKQIEITTLLESIWQKTEFSDFCHNYYMFPLINTDMDLLFIGINPSYDERHKDSKSYHIDNNLLGIPYFKVFDEFAKKTDATWTHIDLLFFRETNQNEIHNILRKPNGATFIYEQLKVAEKLIIHANPKVIIVCNALARLFLGKEKDVEKNERIWLGYEFGKIDEEIGTYILDGKPWFISGMLSGQRALDKGSLERLQWQVKRVLNIRKK